MEKTKRKTGKVRRGFRKIHIGAEVYLWRYYGDKVEIRTPDDQKWIVPIWTLQGSTEVEWLKEHEECFDECSAYWVQPSLVRDYILQRQAHV